MDKWDRNCRNCFHWHQYKGHAPDEGECRRFPPAGLAGDFLFNDFPTTKGNTLCGEHKIGSNPVRDGEKKVFIKYCPEHSWIVDPNCPKCQDFAKSQKQEAKIIEELNEVHREAIKEGKPDDNRKKETITAVYPVDLEEKTRIKAEIVRHLNFMCGDLVIDGKKDDILKYMPSEKQKIQELLKKL